MHPGFEKDYRYLLSDLIPRQKLTPARIQGIESALSSGRRTDMLRESWRAMEELSESGVLDREGTKSSGGRVEMRYRMADGRTSYSLVMSEAEYEGLVPTGEGKGVLPSVISGIISSLNLNGSGATSTEKLESILDLTGHLAFGAKACLLLFSELEIQGIRESEKVQVVPVARARGFPWYSRCLETTGGHIVLRADEMSKDDGLFGIPEKAVSVVLIPLRARRTEYGIMQVSLPLEPEMLDDAAFNLSLIGQGIIRLVDNNRHLEQMVSIDPLTRANNRNYYETQLPLEMERAVRNRKSLGFLIMDIDDFKKFNDRHGHDTGDEVLKMVASVVRKHLRKIDLFFRFGGEEFIVLLPGAGREAAERTAERVREVVSKTGLTTESGEKLSITITIGGCVYPGDADNEKDLFRKADRMLLEAKEDGKNRVRFFDNPGDL